jgi:integrase
MRIETTKAEFPRTITHDLLKGLSVKIYRSINDGTAEYTLRYHNLTGEAKRKVSRDLNALENSAKEILNDLAGGKPADASEVLSAHERDIWAGVNAIFSEVDVDPLVGARHFVEGMKLLGKDLVFEACRNYAERNMHKVADVTLETAKNQFITAKEKSGKSKRYLKDLGYRLNRFAGSMPNKRMADITGADLQTFFEGLDLSAGSFNNFRRVLGCFFEWAKRAGRKYLPRDWSELDAVESRKGEAKEIAYYTPEEMRKLIKFATGDQLPFILIGGFAGLRSAEIARLDWSNVNLKTGFIEVKAGKAKTGSRRLVPIADNLREWLRPIAKESGAACASYSGSFYRELRKMAKNEAKVPLKANGLRHSFCTHRVSFAQDVNKVALEAGNSAQMIFKHYREVVTPQQAEEFFSILPVRRKRKIARLSKEQKARIAYLKTAAEMESEAA